MSITIDIDPSLEAVLRQRATSAGATLEDYLLHLAERDAKISFPPDPVFEESVRKLDAFRGKLGPVPKGAFDPAILYEDR